MIGRETRVLLRHYLEQGLSKAAVARRIACSHRGSVMTTALLARCPAPVAPLPPRGSGPTLPLSMPKTLPFSMPKTLPFSMPIDTAFAAAAFAA